MRRGGREAGRSAEKVEHDDDLVRFEVQGAPALPEPDWQGTVAHDGARLWVVSHGRGPAVVLLHGGYGHSGNWGHQVPALQAAGYRVVLLDTRGHGRSTRDDRTLHYERLAGDLLAVIDHLSLAPACLVGWSDGAVVSLIAALQRPEAVSGVLFFGCAMDPSGLRDDVAFTPILQRCMARHERDFKALSPSPDGFERLRQSLLPLHQNEPHYSAPQLSQVAVPVQVLHAQGDEFIRREHAEYLARTLPRGEFRELAQVTHFAPLQRPHLFNAALLDFLSQLTARA